MADPLKIIVTTETDRFIFDNVVEILIKPHDGGLEFRQDKSGWDLKLQEDENAEQETEENAQI